MTGGKRFALVLLAVMAFAQPGAAIPLTVTRVTVGTSATVIWTAPSQGRAVRVLVKNPSAVTVYLGDGTVTTSTGFELAAGDAIAVNLSLGDKLYGVVATSTQVVETLQGETPQ